MPNWCNNTLDISGDEAEIKRFKENAESYEDKQHLSLEKLYPIPEKENWYNWHVENWGTKWDVDGELINESSETLDYVFDSAWTPPIEAFTKISLDYPTLRFKLEFEETGMEFAGYADIEKGIADVCEEKIESGICPECGDDARRVRGECSMCGMMIEYLIQPVGSVLDSSDIDRSGSPEKIVQNEKTDDIV